MYVKASAMDSLHVHVCICTGRYSFMVQIVCYSPASHIMQVHACTCVDRIIHRVRVHIAHSTHLYEKCIPRELGALQYNSYAVIIIHCDVSKVVSTVHVQAIVPRSFPPPLY